MNYRFRAKASAIAGRLISFYGIAKEVRQIQFREKIKFTPMPVPVNYKADVLVVGGGISGIAAAVGAGRLGASTMMIERQGTLGGLMTAGLVSPFSMQMMLPSGELITRGLVEELLDRVSILGGTIKEWRDWKIPKIPIDIEVFKLVAIEMLEESKVKVLLNTTFFDVLLKDRFISEVLIHNRSGLCAIRAVNIIDSTGEADVARACNVPTTVKADVDPSKVISAALRDRGWIRRTEKVSALQFLVGNTDLDKTHDLIVANPDFLEKNMRGDLSEDVELFSYLWKQKGIFYLPHYGGLQKLLKHAIESGEIKSRIGRYDVVMKDGVGIDGLRSSQTVIINANRVMINPFKEEDVSNAMLEGQKACFEAWRFLHDFVSGFEKSNLLAIAPYLGVRRGAQIIGNYVYTAEERENFLQYNDVIGMASRKTQKAYEVPYSSMIPQKIDNLLVASGKTVSTDDFIPYRFKPVCMILGEAAGTAAALCIESRKIPREIDIGLLQLTLIKNNVYLGDSKRIAQLGIANEEMATGTNGVGVYL
jgi:ribulose 1,5-bisphosphate synthetase/thiazole synthase